MKIALLDCHNDNYKEIYKLTSKLKNSYCDKHGYDFITYNFKQLQPQQRTPHWGRVLGIKEHLPQYDWIFYLDTDLVIMNFNQKIEDLIDTNYDIIVGPGVGEGHLSTSGMVIKNCNFVNNEFLDVWWKQTQFCNQPYIPKKEHSKLSLDGGSGGMYFEQSAFHYLYDTNIKYQNRIKRIKRKYFNSIDCRAMYSYTQGDFLIHFPGETKEQKIRKIKQYIKSKIKLI